MCPVKTRADSSTGDVNNNNGGTAEESPSSPALLKEAEGSYGDQLSGVSINELLRAKCAKESDQGHLCAKSSEELRDIYRRLQDAVKEVGDKYEAGEKAVRDADPSIEPGPTKKSEEEHALDFLRVAREILVADGIRILTILSKRETETSTEVSPAKVIVEEVETVIEETAAAATTTTKTSRSWKTPHPPARGSCAASGSATSKTTMWRRRRTRRRRRPGIWRRY
jgi:hypothetical protein